MAQAFEFDPVIPGKPLQFPRDAGAHLNHRVEWWYVTGQLETKRGPMGFQVTFFRLRNPGADANPSRFSPTQLLFAHAALADPARGRLLHGERSARVLAGLVETKEEDMALRLDDWSLERTSAAAGRAYAARIDADGFALDLTLAPTQPPLPQGDNGFSRKGPAAHSASYYYSEPQLRVAGRVRHGDETLDVTGVAWLDHEWFNQYLAQDAAGWDWIGANLDGGAALMAFRMRGKDGTTLWAGATYRAPGAPARALPPAAVRFTPLRTWKSPRTGTGYPVAMQIDIDGQAWRVEPLMDDQELDARASTGTLYWEGAVRVAGPRGERGRGYLELTGYGARVPL